MDIQINPYLFQIPSCFGLMPALLMLDCQGTGAARKRTCIAKITRSQHPTYPQAGLQDMFVKQLWPRWWTFSFTCPALPGEGKAWTRVKVCLGFASTFSLYGFRLIDGKHKVKDIQHTCLTSMY